MRVMVDTNVILSAILKTDLTPSIVLQYVCQNHSLIFCETILLECLEVAKRRFEEKLPELEILLATLPFELVPSSKVKIIPIQDIKDQPIMNAACNNAIDVLITGDKHFLDLKITKPEILTPSGFKQKYFV